MSLGKVGCQNASPKAVQASNRPILTPFLLIAAIAVHLPLSGAEYFDLRLEEALVSENSKTREWVLSPRLRFTMMEGEAILPVIELKRGWVVPSWKGVVDSIKVERCNGKTLKGKVKAHIHSSIGVSGAYDFSFEARLEGEAVHGSFVSKTGSGEPAKGDLRGTVRETPDPVIDTANSVWTVQLVQALPKKETLTLYLNRNKRRFTSAFAYSPNVTRRPIEVDASKLRFSKGKLSGTILASRLNVREPDGGERSVFGRYEIKAELQDTSLRGKHTGETLDGQPVEGETWGEIRPRRPLSPSPRVWFKLEDGYTGGAMWQNRVFFKASLKENGQLAEGSAGNNKGVFEADLTATNLKLTDDQVTGTLHSTVRKSGSVSLGDYSFRLDGQRAGDVFHGRFYTTYSGKENHSGYFVGGIDR